MSVVLKCSTGHLLGYSIDNASFLCDGCQNSIDLRSLHQRCGISGCMFRLCLTCVAREVGGHTDRKQQTNDGSIAEKTQLAEDTLPPLQDQPAVQEPQRRGRGRSRKRKISRAAPQRQVLSKYKKQKHLMSRMTRKLSKIQSQVRMPRSAAAKMLAKALPSRALTSEGHLHTKLGYGLATRMRYEEEDLELVREYVSEELEGDEDLLGGSGYSNDWSPGAVLGEVVAQAGRLARRIHENVDEDQKGAAIKAYCSIFKTRLTALLKREHVGVPIDSLKQRSAALSRHSNLLTVGKKVRVKATRNVGQITAVLKDIEVCKVSGSSTWYHKKELEEVSPPSEAPHEDSESMRSRTKEEAPTEDAKVADEAPEEKEMEEKKAKKMKKNKEKTQKRDKKEKSDKSRDAINDEATDFTAIIGTTKIAAPAVLATVAPLAPAPASDGPVSDALIAAPALAAAAGPPVAPADVAAAVAAPAAADAAPDAAAGAAAGAVAGAAAAPAASAAAASPCASTAAPPANRGPRHRAKRKKQINSSHDES